MNEKCHYNQKRLRESTFIVARPVEMRNGQLLISAPQCEGWPPIHAPQSGRTTTFDPFQHPPHHRLGRLGSISIDEHSGKFNSAHVSRDQYEVGFWRKGLHWV